MTADVRDQLEGDASDGKLAVEFIDIREQALVGWVSLSQGNGAQIFLVWLKKRSLSRPLSNF